VDGSDQHRDKDVGGYNRGDFAMFQVESAIFDAKLFALTIVQIAFPDDTERQSELLTKILASHQTSS
jgi:hypothetical protein